MLRAVLLLALTTALASAASAPAAVTPLLRAPAVSGVDVAGDRVAIVTEGGREARLVALPAADGPAETLLRDRGDEDHDPNWISLAARGDRIVVASGPDDLALRPPTTSVVRQVRGAGPFATLFSRPAEDPAGEIRSVFADADAAYVATERDLGDDALTAYPDAGAPVSVPLPAGGVPEAAAGGRVALLAPKAGGAADDPLARIVVVDGRTGAVERSVPIGDGLVEVVLRDDGTLAWVDQLPDRTGYGSRSVLRLASPGTGPRTILTAPAGAMLMRPAFAGDAVAVIRAFDARSREVVVVSPEGAARRVGPRGWDVDRLTGDGPRLAWTADGCVVTALATDAPAAALPAGPCARTLVKVESFSALKVPAAPRAIPVPVRCLAAPGSGCAGTIELRGKPGVMGRARFAGVPVGQLRRVRVQLTSAGAARLRHLLGIGLRVGAVVKLHTRVVGIDPQGRRHIAGCGCLTLRRRTAAVRAAAVSAHAHYVLEVPSDSEPVRASSRYAG